MKQIIVPILTLLIVIGAGCAMFKHDVKCPANAYCEAIDFGGVQLTACLSMSEMQQLKSIAAERKASWLRSNQQDAGLVF
jgi:uncharacterized protein YxeA